MTAKVLLVDDEANILQAYQRVLRGTFDLQTAVGGHEALRTLELQGPFAVVVADMRMPGMSGLDLLAACRAKYPRTIRIMLTGDSDQKTAMDAVNHGHVFRFLSKPCAPEELELAIRSGLRQHQLMEAERELLEQTLTGTITVLSELLASIDPVMFSRGQVVRERCTRLATVLGCEAPWEVEMAALLAPIGRMTLPTAATTSRAVLEALQAAVPEVGARLLAPIPRLEGVARIIRYQAKGYDGSGTPEDELQGDAIPLGARILRVLWDHAELEQARRNRFVALEELRLKPRPYDPAVLQALGHLLESAPPASAPAHLRLRELRAGMTLAADLQTAEGGLVLPAGLRLGPGHLELLANLARAMDLVEPVAVQVPEGGRP